MSHYAPLSLPIGFGLVYLAASIFTLGCPSEPQHANAPAPPAIEKPQKPTRLEYPHQAARAVDMIIQGCTLTTSLGNRADCICRNATTKIDAKDKAKQMLVCK